MRHRRKRAGHANHERWLVSYADFITLLFAFFVVLYASSQVDKRKVGRLAVAIQVAFQEMGVFEASTTVVPIDQGEPMPFSTAQAIENTERTAALARVVSKPEGALGGTAENGGLTKLQAELETALAAELKRQDIAMRREADGLVISLREAGFFESGVAQMKASSVATFDRIASLLRPREYRLRIEGHTDNAPIHTLQFPSNWELSTARATEIVRLLIIRDGFAPDRLSAAGYAEFHPVASNRNPEGRAMNRRVDIVVLSQVPPQAALTTNKGPSGAGPSAPFATTPVTPASVNSEKPSPVVALKPTVLSNAGGTLQH